MFLFKVSYVCGVRFVFFRTLAHLSSRSFVLLFVLFWLWAWSVSPLREPPPISAIILYRAAARPVDVPGCAGLRGGSPSLEVRLQCAPFVGQGVPSVPPPPAPPAPPAPPTSPPLPLFLCSSSMSPIVELVHGVCLPCLAPPASVSGREFLRARCSPPVLLHLLRGAVVYVWPRSVWHCVFTAALFSGPCRTIFSGSVPDYVSGFCFRFCFRSVFRIPR